MRTHKGRTLDNITHLETKVTKPEEEETSTEKERHTVAKMAKKLEALSVDCKTYHYTILAQTEDQEN